MLSLNFNLHLKRILVLSIVSIGLVFGGWYLKMRSTQQDHWNRIFNKIGTNSSPRATDLNQDGVADIVLGTGGEEFDTTDIAVLALDGSNGDVLWTVAGTNQVVGSALFKDISGDGIPEVFIGGRSAQFYAINGLTGKVLWQFLEASYVSENFRQDTTLLNFFNSQFIPDQNGDGVEDIVTAFGGYVFAEPEDLERPAGMLMVLDTKSGKVLKKSMVPDGKEIYMSPVVYDFGNGLTIIFGTGGETISGNLYAVTVDDFMVSGTQNSRKIDTSVSKGFIAPPIIADISGDQIGDIVLTTMDGYMRSYNGADFSLIWSKRIHPRGEVQSMPAPLYFDQDKVLDFFSSFNVGQWPKNDTTIHVILSGADGRELFRDTIGMLQFSSAVLLDYNADSFPDLIYPINVAVRNVMFPVYKTQLMCYDGRTGSKNAIDELYEGKCLGSTPLITDLDADGKVDLIYTYMTQFDEFISYRDLVIKRVELDIPMTDNPWGGYMGTDYTSIFKPIKK
jgi:outer membrane protein assembly factor BamB